MKKPTEKNPPLVRLLRKKSAFKIHVHPHLAQIHDGGETALATITGRDPVAFRLIAAKLAENLNAPVQRFDVDGREIETPAL
ncbi:MAG: hypothetical protein H7343_08240 [Undibacterium sp.]|nr:hypothetical protein [Opitutaceae bacterium]